MGTEPMQNPGIRLWRLDSKFRSNFIGQWIRLYMIEGPIRSTMLALSTNNNPSGWWSYKEMWEMWGGGGEQGHLRRFP